MDGNSVDLKGKPLTIKDIQDASDSILQQVGIPDPPIIIDKKAFDTYKNMFNNFYDKFEPGDWVFDGENLLQILKDQGPHILNGTFLTGRIVGVTVPLHREKLVKVPKGSKLEAVKILFGKK